MHYLPTQKGTNQQAHIRATQAQSSSPMNRPETTLQKRKSDAQTDTSQNQR
jgi:hypothetical protein